MAKHKHRDQSARINDANNTTNNNSNSNVNNKSIPFGIDPMQLMGLLGGNFDINNMGSMLSSMNTNGFNLGNLGSIAQMMGLNLDNSFSQGNMSNQNNDFNKNIHTNVNQNKQYSNMNQKGTVNQNMDRSNKKETDGKENDINLMFLTALKSYAHPDRIKFIDKIIEAYKNGEFKDI
ncbi:hypothetical protein CLPUN_32150 [Clostridium puniceum]|uniref:Uncharacterized protein n=1 Tax=Clostridium puniceum TaxID=29367 RepID=A0A1S8TD61_9CLOT|nr:hypothetical protein [Clostridium puniceum]OOM75544.1 hypothetical protein CLPUN_32150 [Clostridium puniceum]